MSARRVALHFAHANGFPGACYRKLFSFLAADFDVGYLPASGHDPRFPVSDGWPLLVEELIASIVGSGRRAGARRGPFARRIPRLSSPRCGGPSCSAPSCCSTRRSWVAFHGSALQLVKRIGLIDRVTPAAITRNRRREWPSLEAALEHFRRKRLFRNFDADCLWDYVHYGTRPSARGVELVFDPGVEYRIYRAIPHDLAAAGRRLAVPAGSSADATPTCSRAPDSPPRAAACIRR